MLKRCWRLHSRTVIGLSLGLGTILGARWAWPEGGINFDTVTLIGGALLALGIQGLLDYYFREVADPKDEP